MTDEEQIIIDGVDVSECLFYQTNFEEDYDVKIKHFCSNWHNSCESTNNSNCYFKQLARKAAECEELKDKIERLEDDLKYKCVDCMNVKSDRYRKAFERIEFEAAEELRNLEADTNVYGCLFEILNIINKAKGEMDE